MGDLVGYKEIYRKYIRAIRYIRNRNIRNRNIRNRNIRNI